MGVELSATSVCAVRGLFLLLHSCSLPVDAARERMLRAQRASTEFYQKKFGYTSTSYYQSG